MLIKPDVKLNRITDINLELLKRLGIKVLLLDVDNTLSTHHGQNLVDGLLEWIDAMKSNGISLLILSNSKERRVKPFAAKIGLDYISLGLKPLPFKFFKALRRLNAKKKQTALVGDQLFTDSLGAHLAGVRSIILNPILPEPMLSFKIRRFFEKILYSLYKF